MALQSRVQPSLAIPTALEPELLEKAAQGFTTRQLSAWLLEAHGVEASHAAVARLLAKHREERAHVTQGVLRQKLGRTIATDLDLLSKHLERLDAMADAVANEGDLRAYCVAVEQIRKVIDTRLHYAGGDTPDDAHAELAAAAERVASRLARLAPAVGADELAK